MAAVPAYLALADELGDRITSMPPGQRLPSEHELATARHVNRLTARAALQELERRHLVRRIQGAGTFVAHRIEYRVGPGSSPSLTETVAAAGVTVVQHNLRTRTVRPPAPIRDALELPAGGRAVVVERAAEVDGMPVSCSTTWLAADLVPGLARAVPPTGSLFRVLVERFGLHPQRVWSRAELELPPHAVAERLALDGRPPTWWMESGNRVGGGQRMLEISRSWLRADVFRVVLELGER